MTTAVEPPPAAPAPPRTLASKVAWSTVASTVAALGGSLAGIFAARGLGAEGMGRFAFLIWAAETIALVFQLGLGRALTRFLAETGSPGLGVWLARRLLGMTTLAAVAFYVVTPWLAEGTIDRLPLALATFLLLASGPDAAARAHLQGTQDFRRLARLNVVAGVMQVIGVGVGAWFFGLPGVLLGYALYPLAGLPVAVGLLRGAAPTRPDAVLRARIRRFSGWFWVSSLIAIVSWSRIELFFLERIGTVAQVGFFAVALRATNLATRFPIMLGSAFMPYFAERFGANDPAAAGAGYAAGTRLVALLLFPCCLGLAATAPLVVPLLYGPDFADAVPIVVVLAVGSCISFANVGNSLIAGADRLHVRVRWAIPAALLMLVLLPMYVPAYGAWGAAWVRVGVRTAAIAVATAYLARRLRVPVPLGALGRTMLAAAPCGLVAYAVCAAWPTPWALLAAVPAGALAYVLALRLLRAVNEEDGRAFVRFASRGPAAVRGPLLWVLRLAGARG